MPEIIRDILADITLAGPRESSACARRTLAMAQAFCLLVSNSWRRVCSLHCGYPPAVSATLDLSSPLNPAPPRQKQSP